jgi:hypothetical protein
MLEKYDFPIIETVDTVNGQFNLVKVGTCSNVSIYHSGYCFNAVFFERIVYICRSESDINVELIDDRRKEQEQRLKKRKDSGQYL